MFISIDLDAFYCGIEERITPRLRGEAFCVVQKHIVATLSYPARNLGLKKLENIHSVRRKHPDMIMVNGEDLSKYRKAGNEIFRWVQTTVGGLPVERLGLEEMRIDLTPIVAGIAESLPPLKTLKEWLGYPEFMDEVASQGIQLAIGSDDSEADPECPNFYFKYEGDTWPSGRETLTDCTSLNAYIAGHLAAYIRDRMWLELGYSCSIGVASTKAMAKMVGNCRKPGGVTVLEPGFEQSFIRTMGPRKVPGLGSACRHALNLSENDTTVGDILDKFDRSAFVSRVSPVVGGPTAQVLWDLLNGNDTEGLHIKPYVLPLQVSVEDSYPKACPEDRWKEEVEKLCSSVLAQATLDWYDDENREWKKVPASCRVSVIFANSAYVRRSKSTNFGWHIFAEPRSISASELAEECLSLLQQLVQHHRGMPRLINVALVS